MELRKLSKNILNSHSKDLNNIINTVFDNYNINKNLNNDFYIIVHNNQFIGMFNLNKNCIQKFFILPQYQKQNLGSTAVKKIIDMKLSNLHCYVKKDNKIALAFWTKNKFIISHNCGHTIKMIYN